MSEFIYLGFKKGELELIDQCRLYHQVLSLTDIADADGTKIDPVYMTKQRHQDRISTLQWPTQGCPSSKAWRQWKLALKFLLYKGKLRTPLGRWTCQQHQRWSWVVRLLDKVLFHQITQGWERYDPIATMGRRSTCRTLKPWYSTSRRRQCRQPTEDLAAATIQPSEIEGDLFTITWSTAFDEPMQGDQSSIREPETPDSAEEYSDVSEQALGKEGSEDTITPRYLQRFQAHLYESQYFTRLIGPMRMPTEKELLEIANHIEGGTLLGCSDGLFSPNSGTGSHAWLFSTPAGEILMQGAGPIDCHPTMLSSYRPELGGLTSLLFLLYVFTDTYEIQGGTVTLFCNNTSAVENIFEKYMKRGIFSLLAVDYNLLVLARSILPALPIKVLGRWVKGHYTGDERRVEHDLNDLVNDIANQFLDDHPRGSEPSSFPMFHKSLVAAAYVEGSMITSRIAQTSIIIGQKMFLRWWIGIFLVRYFTRTASFNR